LTATTPPTPPPTPAVPTPGFAIPVTTPAVLLAAPSIKTAAALAPAALPDRLPAVPTTMFGTQHTLVIVPTAKLIIHVNPVSAVTLTAVTAGGNAFDKEKKSLYLIIINEKKIRQK